MKYTDPSGELFGTIFTAITSGFKNIFRHGVNFDHYNWNKLNNAWQIDKGLFTGNFGQILSKFTWGRFNTFVGNSTAHVLNISGKVSGVSHLEGTVALSGVTSGDNEAFTLGNYIFGPKGFRAYWKDHLFVHEYGHYIQSNWFGPAYLPIVAKTSIISAAFDQNHESRWFEVQASAMGAKYFDKRYGSGASDYFIGSPDHFDMQTFSTGGNTRYLNPRTGSFDQNDHPINGAGFHWFDLIVPFTGLGESFTLALLF